MSADPRLVDCFGPINSRDLTHTLEESDEQKSIRNTCLPSVAIGGQRNSFRFIDPSRESCPQKGNKRSHCLPKLLKNNKSVEKKTSSF